MATAATSAPKRRWPSTIGAQELHDDPDDDQDRHAADTILTDSGGAACSEGKTVVRALRRLAPSTLLRPSASGCRPCLETSPTEDALAAHGLVDVVGGVASLRERQPDFVP